MTSGQRKKSGVVCPSEQGETFVGGADSNKLLSDVEKKLRRQPNQEWLALIGLWGFIFPREASAREIKSAIHVHFLKNCSAAPMKIELLRLPLICRRADQRFR